MTAERRYGLQKVTLADFPGEVAATLFTTGCNMRCPYCHNADLAVGRIPTAFFSFDEIFSYLTKRKTVLTGVCITGGEPLLDPHIFTLIDKIHDLGLKIKLDTNGSLPEKLARAKCEFIAMDFKTRPSRYKELGFSVARGEEAILESIHYIIQSSIAHEFRTTSMPTLVEAEDLHEMIPHLQGCDHYVLAQFNPNKTLSPLVAQLQPHSKEKMQSLLQLALNAGIPTSLRGVD